MIFQPQLRIPGPTPLPERVVRAMSRPMIDHRGPEFASLLADVTAGLKEVFRTASDVVLLTCSGTGGLEAAVANFVSPGEQVVCASCGAFGDRFAGILEAYGADVVRLEAEWGQPVEPRDLADVLDEHPGARSVFLTHNETSTGLTNPLEQLAAIARERDRLVVVDGVSSVSSIPMETDRWGLDVVVSGSQKGWMAPPGLAFLSVSQRAWERQAQAKAPRFYFDLAAARQLAAKGMTPWTPAVGVVYGLREGIEMIREEGLENGWARHRRLADAVAAGLSAAGFSLFAAEGYRSATVTSAYPPAGLDIKSFRKLLREGYGVVIAGGQGKLDGQIIRIGHLGAVTEGDVVQVLWAVEQALEELDIAAAQGQAIAAGGRVLAGEAAPALA
jgi:aspartate aminotransferase-like enzyme